jgi:hypothetical protein
VTSQRRYFWDHVYERLDRLGNRISLDERRRIESAVALKVPRLSREEHEADTEFCRESLLRHFGKVIEHKAYREPA